MLQFGLFLCAFEVNLNVLQFARTEGALHHALLNTGVLQCNRITFVVHRVALIVQHAVLEDRLVAAVEDVCRPRPRWVHHCRRPSVNSAVSSFSDFRHCIGL